MLKNLQQNRKNNAKILMIHLVLIVLAKKISNSMFMTSSLNHLQVIAHYLVMKLIKHTINPHFST